MRASHLTVAAFLRRDRGYWLRRRNRLRICYAAQAALAGSVLGATPASWTAPLSDSWTSVTAWSIAPLYPNNFQPAATDLYDAAINATGAAYSVTLNSDITIDSLVIASPDVTFQHNSGTLRLVNGGLAINAGTYQFNGGTIASDDSMPIKSRFDWNGGTLAGFGLIDVSAGALVTIDTAVNHTLARQLNNSGTLNIVAGGLTLNNGTLVNRAGGVINISTISPIAVSTLASLFRNDGIMNIAVNGLVLPAMVNSGTINVGSQAGVTFSGSTTFEGGSTISGPGDVSLSSSGTITLAGALNLLSPNVSFNSGSINGSGDLLINNVLSWGGGTLTGTGVATVSHNATLNLGVNTIPRTLSRQLNNSGTINMTGGTLLINGGSLINGSGPLINNTDGVINISGGSITAGAGQFNNMGTINVTASSVVLPVMTDSGTINVAAGASASTSQSGTVFEPGATVTGLGTVTIAGESVTANGTLNLLSAHNVLNGSITGSGNVVIGTSLAWTSGTLSGSGQVFVPNNSLVTLSAGTHGLSRRLNNSGTFNIAAGFLFISQSGTFANLSDGIVNISSGTISESSPTTLFVNAGTIDVTAPSFQMPPMINSGTLIAEAGASFSLNSSTFQTGATLAGLGTINIGSNIFSLDGTLTLASPHVNFNVASISGSGDLFITGGLNWNTGTIGGTGVATVAHGSTISISTNSSRTLSRRLNNSGTITIAGSGLTLSNTLTNLPDGVLNIGTINGTGLINNMGTLNISANVGSPGLIDSGTINVPAGANISFNSNPITFESGATISGTGSLTLASSNITLNGTPNLVNPNITLASGNINGPGDLLIGNTFTWAGGSISGGGSLIVPHNATLNSGSSTSMRDLLRELDNSGTINLSAGSLRLNNAVLNNLADGVINFGASGNATSILAVGANHFTNAGTINVPNGTLQIFPLFGNSGTVEVGAGGPAGATFSGGVSDLVGTTLVRGTWIVHPSSSISTGSIGITSNAANVTLDGAGSSFPAINSIRSNSGTFKVIGGRSFTSSASYTNTGRTVIGTTSALKITGTLTNTGTIDVNGILAVDYTGASPIADIMAQIVSGRAHGAWNGLGINSTVASLAAFDDDTMFKPQVGYAEASALGIFGGGTFGGLSIDDTTVLVRLVVPGDFNLDGRANALDLNIIATNYGKTGARWSDGDADFDGIVNNQDFVALAINFGQTVPAAPPGTLASLVPEPIAVAMLAALGLARIRRRHRIEFRS